MKTVEVSIKEYLTTRRALGYKLRDTEKLLLSFALFLKSKHSRYITTPLALEWATESSLAAQSQHAKRLSAVRLFAVYRKIFDPQTEIPPAHILPYRSKRAAVHIYTDAEICAIMHKLATAHPTNFKNQSFTTIFGLLAVSGCRSGEVLALSYTDVDFKGMRIRVCGKGGARRLVPLHTSAMQALRQYERSRNSLFRHSETFFVSTANTPIAYCDLERTFLRVSKSIGLRSASANHGPRIHDLRHTFAVRTVLRWYKQNLPVEKLIPVLSAYLGHVKPSDTYWYLTGVPELFALAAKRLPELRS